ncbi:MAG: single-stranded-DNA-specific exonuclease RecJ [Opitutales bacterium]|nr:single-stranded-DNA-specific exonuclease RecJ [Opitutales bacterium]
MNWIYNAVNGAPVAALSRSMGISKIAATLLVKLGITDRREAQEFLNPLLRMLQDPFALKNMDLAVARIRKAMRKGESIMVFGDYDVDGVTSTTFLSSVLRRFGIRPNYIVPLRQEEGYGLSIAALERALKDGTPNLLIAVDCGTNSKTEVAYLRERGVDVVILDHHTSKEDLPEDCVIVNPHVYDGEDQKWSQLCAVGIVFKCVHALLKALREEGDELAHQIKLKDYLDLVAMGTIADLVPLRGENRILAKTGLVKLKETPRAGLNALFEVCNMQLGDEVSPYDISFKLGPRINACGRLADATNPIELLLSEDWSECRTRANELNDLNRQRQEIERSIAEEAEQMVNDHYSNRAGLVLYNEDWHSGVVGIVASRISHLFHRPTIVLGREGVAAKGSGRSIRGINLVDALNRCTHLLENWGGHPMAVGVGLNLEHLEAFRDAFNDAVLHSVDNEMPEPELDITCRIQVEDLGEHLLQELDQLAPFGQGNPEPVFEIQATALVQPPVRFGQGHFRFFLETAFGRMNGVAWKMEERIPQVGQLIDMAVRLQWNVWNDQRYPQVTLVDWKPAKL